MIEIQRYIELFKDYPLLKPKEERKFLKLIRTPPEGVDPEAKTWELTLEQKAARDEFICRNIRLVIHTSKKFCRLEDPRMLDFISAGVQGMLHALDIFDLSREVRFSTYANWWIQAKIRKEITVTDTKVVRHKTIYETIKRLRNSYLKEGVYKSDEQLFVELEWPIDKITKYKEDVKRLKISLDTIDTTMSDFAEHDEVFCVDAPQDQVLEDMFKEEQLTLLNEAFEVLTAQERVIVQAHFGISGSERTYDELSQDIGITREQVRRIEAKALAKLWRVMTTQCPSLRD